MRIEETIQRLRDKASHPATPRDEAETCRRMAAKLEVRHGVTTTVTLDAKARPDADPWSEARVTRARSRAVGQALRQYGAEFDPNRFSRAYDRSVKAQKGAQIKFDPYLAFEHTCEQYDADVETDIRHEIHRHEAVSRLQGLSDLEIAAELSRLAHTMLEIQTKIGDMIGEERRFRRATTKRVAKVHEHFDRQYETAMQRFRLIEGEIERRSQPIPEALETDHGFRFAANPYPA